MSKKMTKDEFILKATQIHNLKYDYSKVEYNGNKDKICIICPEHGEFWQTPNGHLRGHGCKKCSTDKHSRLMTKEQFILKARQVHGWKYDYSKVEYVNSNTKVCIICPEHGEFWQTPNLHLSGRGCSECGGTKKLTTVSFIEKAEEIHGNKYDYSKVRYTNATTKVCIICPEHGEFWQVPSSHLKGNGCRKCGGERISLKKTKTTEQFIVDAKKVHGDRYDYTKVNYIGKDSKVCIICHEHGEFWQMPHNHLHGAGCPDCKKEYFSKLYKDTTETFIKKARMVHGDKYDYSKVEYIDSHTPVCIICNEHGEFWQRPNNHLHGYGCSKCSGIAKKTNEEFIEEAKSIHGDKYDYSKVEYVNANTKVCIICPEHGSFSTYPASHVKLGVGCPKCAVYKMEQQVMNMLDENKIDYVWQYKPSWLKRKSIDFYLPEFNIGIECQGEQHYRPVKFYGGQTRYKRQVVNDDIKKEKCKENGITLLYYTTLNDIEKNENTFNSVLDIKNFILNT